MIDRLYNLKVSQTEQKLIEKATLNREVDEIDKEIIDTQNRINSVTVDKMGSISDFVILAMHKDTLRYHIKTLTQKKISLQTKIESLFQEIIELQKESEQYKYILDEERKAKMKAMLDLEASEAEEFIQSKYIKAAG